MANKELYDWSSWTESGGSLSLFGHMIRWGLAPEKYSDSTTFKAVALSDSYELDSVKSMAIDGGATGTTAAPRMAFKGRIIGANSPHSFLPNPCDPTWTKDENATWRIIAMHTTFLSPSTSKVTPVTRGDIVLVKLRRSGQAYNLEYGSFEELISVENPTAGTEEECVALVDLFGKIANKPFNIQGGDAAAPTLTEGGSAPRPVPQPGDHEGYLAPTTSAERAGSAHLPGNFFQIPGNNNWRSARIRSYEQLKRLKDEYGITTIINLAADSTKSPIHGKPGQKPSGLPEVGDAGCGGQDRVGTNLGASGGSNACEPKWAAHLNMHYVQIGLGTGGKMIGANGPTIWKEIQELLEDGNTLIHCTSGTDRTGGTVGKWIILRDPSVTPEKLLKEYIYKFGRGQWCRSSTHSSGNTDPNRALRIFIFQDTPHAAASRPARWKCR